GVAHVAARTQRRGLPRPDGRSREGLHLMADVLQIDVIATAARTPLGLRSAPSAAALRAGINRLGEHPSLLDRLGKPMVAALDGKLDPAMPANDRFVTFAQHGLEELSEHLADAKPLPRIPLWVALPEIRPGFTERDAYEIHERLQRTTGLA